MKMKKILSSLTAGVMAATTILTSALITPMMSLTASAGTTGDCYLFARDEHWAMGGDNYDPFATQISNVTGDGTYTVTTKNPSSFKSGNLQDFYFVIFEDLNETNFTDNLKVDSVSFSTSGKTYTDVDHTVSEDEKYMIDSNGDYTWAAVVTMDATAFAGETVAAGDSISVTFTVGKDTPVATATTTTTGVTTTTEAPVTTTESSVTTAVTTAPASKDREAVLSEDVDENDNRFVEFDPMGAKSLTFYYKVKSNDTQTTLAFGYMPTDGGKWKQEQFEDQKVPSNKEMAYDYTIPSDVGDSMKASVYWPHANEVEIVKVVLHDVPDVVTTTTESKPATTETTLATTETTPATTETTSATETTPTTESKPATTETTPTTESKPATTETTPATTASTVVTTVATTTAAPVTTTEKAPQGKGIVMSIQEKTFEPGDSEVQIGVDIKNAVASFGYKYAIDIPEVTARILTLSYDIDSFDEAQTFAGVGLTKSAQGYVDYTADRGASGTGVDNSIDESKRRIFVSLSANGGAFTAKDGALLNMTVDISDKAVAVAEE